MMKPGTWYRYDFLMGGVMVTFIVLDLPSSLLVAELNV